MGKYAKEYAEYKDLKALSKVLGKAWLRVAGVSNIPSPDRKTANPVYLAIYKEVRLNRGVQAGIKFKSYKEKHESLSRKRFSAVYSKYYSRKAYELIFGKPVYCKSVLRRHYSEKSFMIQISISWGAKIAPLFYGTDQIPDAIILKADKVKVNSRDFDLYAAVYVSIGDQNGTNGFVAVEKASGIKRVGLTPEKAIASCKRAVVDNLGAKMSGE